MKQATRCKDSSIDWRDSKNVCWEIHHLTQTKYICFDPKWFPAACNLEKKWVNRCQSFIYTRCSHLRFWSTYLQATEQKLLMLFWYPMGNLFDSNDPMGKHEATLGVGIRSIIAGSILRCFKTSRIIDEFCYGDLVDNDRSL